MKNMTIYFNATDFDKDYEYKGQYGDTTYAIGTAANALFKATIQDNDHEAIVVDGCAVNDNMSSGLFAFHLESQVAAQINTVREALKKLAPNEKLTLNLFGHSRGGIATYLMCQGLKDVSPEKLAINLVAIEPVPGNYVWTSYLDHGLGLNLSIASRSYDMRDCKNLNHALVIFANDAKMSAVFAHAPLLPMFPQSTNVTVDVVESNHMTLQRFYSDINEFCFLAENTMHMAIKFLREQGTVYKPSFHYGMDYFHPIQMQHLITQPIQRSMQFYNTIHTQPDKPYTNHAHYINSNTSHQATHTDYSYHVQNLMPGPVVISKRNMIAYAVFLTGMSCGILAATPLIDGQALKIASALLGLAAMAVSIAYLSTRPTAPVQKTVKFSTGFELLNRDQNQLKHDSLYKAPYQLPTRVC